MKWGFIREQFARLNRVQKSRQFKLIASSVVLVLAIGAVVAYAIDQRGSAGSVSVREPTGLDVSRLSSEERAAYEAERSAMELTAKAYTQLMSAQADVTAVAVGAAIATGLLLGVIWIGLGLTGLFFLLFLAGFWGPIALFADGRPANIARFVIAMGVLAFAFVVLMELLRSLLGYSSAVTAIARNVVLESTRMKVAVVFVVLLIFGLSALPGLLDPSTPLRYRVQSFLSYGAGGSFWIIAILTVFLSVATVAFEQRDRIIWQTMTKPVAAWQYLLGKWAGVAGVAAVLLGVSCAGVFLFTEHLRGQPASGEIAPYQPRESGVLMTEDREILETQVLSARAVVQPSFVEMTREEEEERFRDRVELAQRTDPNFVLDDEKREEFLTQIRKEVRASYTSVPPGQFKEFAFKGLKEAREDGSIVTLRYKIDVGANDPREVYRLSFGLRNGYRGSQTLPLGQMLTLRIEPTAIEEDGTLYVLVANGEWVSREDGEFMFPNAETLNFPPDGLEVFYPAGSYRANFLRVVAVLWLKLAFLAMVGVVTATFLSFPVASLVSFGVLFIAETAGFLNNALDYYASVDQKGNLDYVAMVVRAIAVPIARGFQFYAELKPTTDLVEGRLISWGRVAYAAAVISVLCAVLYAIGVMIFRKRELATYSGQ